MQVIGIGNPSEIGTYERVQLGRYGLSGSEEYTEIRKIRDGAALARADRSIAA